MGQSHLLSISVALLFSPLAAHAYTPFLSSSGKGVHWAANSRFNLAAYARNNSALSESDLFGAVTRGLQRWQAAAQGGFHFDYWQGTDLNIYERTVEYDGLSALHFTSYDPPGTSRQSRSVLGVTQVWYQPESGEILEADVILNDIDYQFTLDPKDTTGPSYYPNTGAFGRPKVYLENVMTHELGHAVGVSHSGVMESTMLPLEGPEQSHLSCDDQAAARSIYGAGGARLQGRVTGPSGQVIFGANVVAVSLARGSAFASGISGPNGEFEIEGLEAGQYVLMAEPYPGSAESLSTFFNSMNTVLCGGRPFSRTFMRDGGGGAGLAIFALGSGHSVAIGDIRAECASGASVTSSTAYPGTESQDRLSFAGGVAALVDRFYAGVPRQFRFNHPGGSVSFATVAFGIYSPVDTQLELLDALGSSVAQSQRFDDTFISSTGYRNYDARVNVASLAAGEYQVRVRVAAVSSAAMPAGQMASDSVPFSIVTGLQGRTPVPGPDLGRCRSSENFGAYQSPGGNPPRVSVDGNVGFCGRVEKVETGFERRMGRPGAGLGAIAGWFLPWALMLGAVRFLRGRVARRTVKV